MESTLHLLLIADDPLARAGLAMLLTHSPSCLVVGQANQAEAATLAIADLADEEPNVIVWDLGWETAVSPLPPLTYPIIALLADPQNASHVWRQGVQGLLPRHLAPDKLLAAAQAVAEDLCVVDPIFLPHLLATNDEVGKTAVVDLTPREADVLQLMAEGLTNKAIGQRLDISNHTVKFHVNAIMTKLHAQSRTEAVVRATRQGLILL